MFKGNQVWLSPNGKWKIHTLIQEQTLNNGEKVVVSCVNVKSFVRENVWRSENMNTKLPKYVRAELDRIHYFVSNVRREKIAQ